MVKQVGNWQSDRNSFCKIIELNTNREINRNFNASQNYNIEDSYSKTINNAKEVNNSLIDKIVNEILDQLRIYYN